MKKNNPEFDHLFEFKSYAEEIEHRSRMNSLRILSEVEKAMERLNMSKKELAKKCGTSPSYLTQLFRATRNVNLTMMAKFEMALDIDFVIKSK